MKILKLLLLTLIVVAPMLTESAAVKKPADAGNAPGDTAQVSVEPGKEFIYKQSGGKPQQLEVYFPSGWDAAKSKVPGVILFHGGGWSGGSLAQFRYACKYFASRGLVAATANYRMLSTVERRRLSVGESYKRACITDAKSAIRWMKQHAAELGIDPQRIITGGGSAGGHVAILATTNPELNDPSDPMEFDTGVAAYLLFNPALQDSDRSDPEVCALQHLKGNFSPAVFFFGTRDQTWKPGSDAALQQLKTIGNTTAELWVAEGQGHGFFNNPPWQDETLAEADRFLVKHGFLGGTGTLPPPKSGEKLIQAP